MVEVALPVAMEVECLVLGSVLLDETLLHDVRPVLGPDDFAIEKHRRIWGHIAQLYDAGAHVDRVTVATALKDAGELESVDGVGYLVELDNGLPRFPHIASYVRILHDKTIRRRIIGVADALQRRAASNEGTQTIIDSLGGLALDMAPVETGMGLVSVGELVEQVGINQILAPRVSREFRSRGCGSMG
jgi:replicative DNA helicase